MNETPGRDGRPGRAASAGAGEIRADLRLIADLVAPGTRALDVGCGDGALLQFLTNFKEIDGRGLEIRQERVNASVSRGLSVIQGNAETDLRNYPSQAFDYVILSQTLQAIHDPRGVLEELLRIGKRAIVSFTNFGYWRFRLHLACQGRMPVTDSKDHEWFDTPNIHLCTIRDFVMLCDALGITVERCFSVRRGGQTRRVRPSSALANLIGEQAVFLLGRE
jgi:methionine biosynthesis protein MetW